MYSNVLQTARMASEMAQNPITINWSYSTNTITYNEHDHIPHIQIHAHSTNTITSKKHDHIQQTQKHSTIHYKFSHLLSTITFNTFEHTHTQQRRNQSHSAGPDHIQQSRSRHFLVVNKSRNLYAFIQNADQEELWTFLFFTNWKQMQYSSVWTWLCYSVSWKHKRNFCFNMPTRVVYAVRQL